MKALRADGGDLARLAGAAAALARVAAELPLARRPWRRPGPALIARVRDAELAAELSVAIAEVAKAESSWRPPCPRWPPRAPRSARSPG